MFWGSFGLHVSHSVLYVVKQFKALAELYLLPVFCEHVMSTSGMIFVPYQTVEAV